MHNSFFGRLSAAAVILLIAVLLCPSFAAKAEAQILQTGIPVEENPELFLPRTMPTHGVGKIAVFLIEFPDYQNGYDSTTASMYEKLFFGTGDFTDTGADDVGCIADFFRAQSNGRLTLEGKVFDWYTAKHQRSYYNYRKGELIAEAAAYYASLGEDFSQFDGDGDGVADAVVYYFAGEYTTGRDDPWYPGVEYASREPEGYGKIGDLTLNSMVQVTAYPSFLYNKAFEATCHELMHTLGMYDLYTAEGNGFPVKDLLADNSPTINPYIKILLGWMDEVRLVTDNTEDIRLESYGGDSPEQAVIVTDSFDGLFGEFYVVAYRKYMERKDAVIWHIDARTDSYGTSFAYNNLYFDPRPDKTGDHAVTPSRYLFIEELSADPDADFLTETSYSLDLSAFYGNSVLGPDTMPSSDTHDGRFTGIRMSGFTEHDNEYLTFDVSFVADTASPVAVTKEGDLELEKTVTIKFNEHIYAADGLKGITVTDPDGNVIAADVILPNYPKNEVEITFRSEEYKNGYRLIFAEGCLSDSSGNGLAAVTFTVSKESFLFPVSDTELPDTGKYTRADSRSFSDGDGLTVISALDEGFERSDSLEFMCLGTDGRLLARTVLENPFENSRVADIIAVGNGSYVAICQYNDTPKANLLFCIDSDGSIKWTNDTYGGSEVYMLSSAYILQSKTLALAIDGENDRLAFVDYETGKTEIKEHTLGLIFRTVPLGNGKFIRFDLKETDGRRITVLELTDADTGLTEATASVVSESEAWFSPYGAYANADGTYLLYGELNQKTVVYLLDCGLQTVRSMTIGQAGGTVVMLGDGGFYELSVPYPESGRYRVRRYDRYLKLLWKSSGESGDTVRLFRSPSGEIAAYREAADTGRFCIEVYGSEAPLVFGHTHSFEDVGEAKATCLSEGVCGYRHCTECGCRYTEDGKTLIVSVLSMYTPKAEHIGQVIPAVAPTCGEAGTTEGVKCGMCGEILAGPQKVSATGAHEYGEWTVVKEATDEVDGEEIRSCAVCGHTETRVIYASEHVLFAAGTVTAVIVALIVVACFIKKNSASQRA